MIRADDEAPGTIARVLTAAPARRQAIFSALAAHEVKAGVFDAGEDLFPQSFAEVIRHGRVADILRAAFGDVPEGYPGLLERIGERPLDRPGDYLAIHQMLARNDVRAADALRGAGRITRRKLEVLSALDVRWHHSNTLVRIDTGPEALTFNAAVNFVQSVSTRATDEAVAQAIALMRPTSTLPRLLDRLLRRADRMPPHPLPVGDDQLRPLATMRALIEAGRRYRNCLSHRLAEVAAGKMAVAEFRDECLVEFRPLTQGAGWILRDVHIERNAPTPLTLIAAVESKCDALGFARIDEVVGGDWKSYRRFTGELEWG
ncbi:hypothetical protein [Brevundimonas sp. UBA7664]|uniref:hypothetical protein n=1 Tax=Brevundimonas sp. UBA7664 TaxID=1946141 RepID=UPI0025C38035|nr:hypothetical protein [Brevundimonas sp. UBA7664]